MSRIRSKNTKPELLVQGWLGKDARRGDDLFGRPDFYVPKLRLAIFVHGCFWHACKYCYKTPKTNRAFWLKKKRDNKARFELVSYVLGQDGYNVAVLWEHTLSKSRRDDTQTHILRLMQFLRQKKVSGFHYELT